MAKIDNIKGEPFARLSAEEEKSYIGDIFYKQQYYSTLIDLTGASVSRFILGQRGQGKTATILHMMEDMKVKGVLPILVDRYDGFPLQQNKNYFLYIMVQKLTFKIALRLMEKRNLRKNLTKNQQEQLAFFVEAFYEPECAEECVATAKNIEDKKRRNKIKKFINDHLSFLNRIIGMVVKVGADLIKSHAGLDVDISNVGGDYIQGFEIESFNGLSREDIVAWDSSKLVKVLKSLTNIAISCDYHSIVFLFDKIDELPEVHSDINKVNSFIIDLLTDTELLYSDYISIVVSLWSEAKNSLNKSGVRFDKFKEVDLRWRNSELIELMDKRLLYFSIDKINPVTFELLVPDSNERNKIMELADGSPRSFISLLGYILAEEESDRLVASFSSDALSKGCLMFCKKFDYISAQPSRTGKGSDLQTWITRLLRLKLTQFTLGQYCVFFNIKQKTGGNHIDTLIKYNLIRDTMLPMDDGAILYEVVDPRIRHLISRGILDLDR